MEDIQFQNGVSAALSHTGPLLGNRSKVQSLTGKDWDSLKQTIEEVYLNQGNTLKQLANYLEANHGFRPTRRQLLHRISGWGFEKNMKRTERRAIIKRLGPELGKTEFEAQKLRGRTIDEAKLNRWMKLEKATSEKPLTEVNEVPCSQAGPALFQQNLSRPDQDSNERVGTQNPSYEEMIGSDPQVQEMQSISALPYTNIPFDWSSVDVVGSPGLTRLIGALTIEECEIPLLSLDFNSIEANDDSGMDPMDLCDKDDLAQEECTVSTRQQESWSTRFSNWMNTSQTSGNLGHSSHPSLHFEVYPFSPSYNQYNIIRRLFSRRGALKTQISETECESKLRNLRHISNTEIIDLVEAMGSRAEEMYRKKCYLAAETWFRRVVEAKKSLKKHKPHQTLWASLHVVRCLYRQSRLKEAKQLHQNLHCTIDRIFSFDHDISVKSRDLNAKLLNQLGFNAEAADICRQVLQIRLNTLGVRHSESINALEFLGCSLSALGRQHEAQNLLETSLHFQLDRVKNSGDSLGTKLDALSAISSLSRALRINKRYDESEYLLDCAHNLLGDVTRQRTSVTCLEYHYDRATTFRLQKRWKESEKILRGLLKFHRIYMNSFTSMSSMVKLAQILGETGRYREAAYWRKKAYLLDAKMYGYTHRYAMKSCESAGFCYIDDRRYNEGISFFEKAIRMIDLSKEEPASRSACIQKINSWIVELEEMKTKNSMDRTTENLGDVDVESVASVDDIDYEDMGDVPDPLDC